MNDPIFELELSKAKIFMRCAECAAVLGGEAMDTPDGATLVAVTPCSYCLTKQAKEYEERIIDIKNEMRELNGR